MVARTVSPSSARLRIRQRGFTLIELICVIVILGTLAATALPKFSDFQREARTAVVNRSAAEVAGAARMAYHKCLLVNGCYLAGGGTMFVAPSGLIGKAWYGWPTGLSRAGDAQGIKDWITVSGYTVHELSTAVTEFRLVNSSTPTSCLVRYTETATLGVQPSIIAVTTGC